MLAPGRAPKASAWTLMLNIKRTFRIGANVTGLFLFSIHIFNNLNCEVLEENYLQPRLLVLKMLSCFKV
jgi:hypothetical protein